MGVYPGLRSRRGAWEKQKKMNSQNPGAKKSVGKRRKVEGGPGTSESREGGGKGKSGSAASRDSCKGLEHGEENSEPSRSREEFREAAIRMAAENWVEVSGSLMDQMEESIEYIEGLTTSGEICARCEDMVAQVGILAADQLRESRWALQEYSRRYTGAVRGRREAAERGEGLAKENEELANAKKELAKKDAEREISLKRTAEEKREAELERNQLCADLAAWRESLRRLAVEKGEAELEKDRLRAALATVEAERDQLRAALATREVGEREMRTPPPPDTEPEEVEMREETPPSSSSGVTVPAILGALEEWFEAKWGQMVSQLTPPLYQGERSGTADRQSVQLLGQSGRSKGQGETLPPDGDDDEPPPGGKRRSSLYILGCSRREAGWDGGEVPQLHEDREEKEEEMAGCPGVGRGGDQSTAR